MQKVKIDLKHCYGIKALKHEFDFDEGGAFAIYAPNGSMKTSLAETFRDAAKSVKPRDRIFPTRQTTCNIIDEAGAAIEGGRVLVFGPIDEAFGPSAKTSTLLVNADLRRQHEKLRADIEAAKTTLVAALKKQASTKSNIEAEISTSIMRQPSRFELAMTRIQPEILEQTDAPFRDVQYDKIFNEAVVKGIAAEDVVGLIETYTNQYNSLLEGSVFFKKGTFDYYGGAEIAKSLANHGFFKAKHTVRLNGAGEAREIKDRKELEAIIEEEKAAILSDPKLKSTFEAIFKKLHGNAALRDFADYVSQPGNEPVLSQLNNVEAFRQEVIKSYVKSNEGAYLDLMSKMDAARAQDQELRAAAEQEKTEWAAVIRIFNDRFVVPFKLKVKNEIDVIIGRDPMPELGFTYVDGKDQAPIERGDLLSALSTGEKKAFYILNVIFEIRTRQQLGEETLIVVDDVADSFDYQNKYAIIQYLMDIKENGSFKQIIMTHNFDFFRTISSRFVGYGHSLMAEKTDAGIKLQPASGIENIFANDWKKNFFVNDKKKIASIPFLRNLVEFTKGKGDPDFLKLTSMLHWKADTGALTVAALDELYARICGGAEKSKDADRLIIDLIETAADDCLGAPSGMNFENKVVLAIAIRMRAEKYMTSKINDPTEVGKIKSN